jgi:hypothetical protein
LSRFQDNVVNIPINLVIFENQPLRNVNTNNWRALVYIACHLCKAIDVPVKNSEKRILVLFSNWSVWKWLIAYRTVSLSLNDVYVVWILIGIFCWQNITILSWFILYCFYTQLVDINVIEACDSNVLDVLRPPYHSSCMCSWKSLIIT